MSRAPIIGRIAAILDAAPTHEPSGFPQRFTHRELARELYGVKDPTDAQLSAVRRAVAKLVDRGLAERVLERRPWAHTGRGWHARRSGKTTHYYANPIGVEFTRPMTDADREARAVVVARFERRAP